MSWHPITHNFWWKLASLTLAVFLWYAVEGEPEQVASRALPVYFEKLAPELLLTAEVPAAVRVEMRGPAGKLAPSSLSDTIIRLDLSPVTAPGERTFTLSSLNLNLPAGVAFLRATPSQLRLNFDRNVTKDVPVEIRLAGAPPAGFHVDSQAVSPAILRIAGPEQHVNRIAMAHTDAIDVTALTADTTLRVNTFVEDSQVRLESSPIVTVKLSIRKTAR
ncbi:MAG TPA: CdaR family protein [Bryobacteraceae bacterium]|jgi:hypothetical protein|nr:CdaR family protein [Bryobacteraceae bacterium]